MIRSFLESFSRTHSRALSGVPISRIIFMTASLAPPCLGPFKEATAAVMAE
jgi:hypothetical protein